MFKEASVVAHTATHFASCQCENTVFPHLWERKAKQPRGHATQQQQRLLPSLNRLKARSVKRLLFESVKCLNKGNNHFYKSYPVVALGKCVTHPIRLQQAPLKQGNSSTNRLQKRINECSRCIWSILPEKASPRASVLAAVDTYTQIHIEKHTKYTRATATPGFHRMHEVIPNKLLVSPAAE